MFSNRVFQAASIFCSAFLLSAISLGVSDEPDLKREQRLHQIYKLYNSAPTKEENWAGVVSGKTQTYSVQEGDTLWDLSSALFGDSQFWPKVWSLNSEKIENPHQIIPGLEVHFTPGTTGEAPSLAVKPAEKIPEVKQEENPDTAAPALTRTEENYQDELIARAEIPPETPTAKATQLPGSIPHWTFGSGRQDLIIQVKKIKRNYGNPEQPLTTFVADQKVQGIGVVTETELNQNAASDFQFIYIKFNQKAPAKTVYAAKDAGELKDPVTGSTGQLIQILGEMEVLEPVNSQENVYRAMVKKAISPIDVGSQVLAGAMPKYTAIDQGGGSGAAQIVGGQYASDQKMFGPQTIVYLSGQGLVANQTYPIFKQQALRNEKTKIQENPRQIGKAKVLKVSEPFATGVILQATEDIRVGDVTSPQLIKK